MLHLATYGKTLDQLRSSGCLVVPPAEWPALRDQIVSLQKQGYSLVAHLSPDGNVTIGTASGAAPTTQAVSAKDFIAYTNQTRQPIKDLQTSLAKAGFDPGAIDGISGPRTTAAVKAFQQANGLAADGIVGPQTGAALAAAGGALRSAAGASVSSQVNSPLDKLPQSASYGLLQRLTPGQVTLPPTDFTTQNTGAPDLSMLGMTGLAPNLAAGVSLAGNPNALPSIPNVGAAVGWNAPAAPTPLPTPGFALPRMPRAPAPAQTAQNLVRLPSGKMVAPGTYNGSNPGSMVTVSDDGHGNAVVKESNLGLMNPAKMGGDTVVGGYIGKQIAPAVSGAIDSAKAALAPQATRLAGDISNGASALTSQIGSAFSNMFGGGNNTPPPLLSAPVYAPPPPPTTQYTTKQMQVSNPAYEQYIAAQKADDIGAGPNFADLQSMNANAFPVPQRTPSFALPRLPAPPQFITKTVQVPLPAAPAQQPLLLRLIQAAATRPPVTPAPQPGNAFLAARGDDVSNMSAGQQANALMAALSGSHHGSFGV